jgi:hypothetical protein
MWRVITHPLAGLAGMSLRQRVQALLLQVRHLHQLSVTRGKLPAGSSSSSNSSSGGSSRETCVSAQCTAIPARACIILV